SDNGSEFYEHKKVASLLQAKFYFAHPYSSWERGLNEYTNTLIRQYIPKKGSFENYDDDFIKNVQHRLNRRPRKLLNFEAPWKVFADALNKSVALAI
ncbi:MAG: IS30 family transposase, partial [Prevotellaceae bacterium]|nr:IS30 family transposase [Prevotellaceae bacterium]